VASQAWNTARKWTGKRFRTSFYLLMKENAVVPELRGSFQDVEKKVRRQMDFLKDSKER